MPDDAKLNYEFDQSVYVINSIKSMLSEGAIGAILTGLMVLLFLGDACCIDCYLNYSNLYYFPVFYS